MAIARGIFLFENGEFCAREFCAHNKGVSRVVRVGMQALKADSKTTLWGRLSQHQDIQSTGGGHHRGSIFRLLVGQALICRDGLDVPSWGVKKATERLGVTKDQVKQSAWSEAWSER